MKAKITKEQNDKNKKRLSEVLLVGIDDNGEDIFTLVVGRKNTEKKETEILNIIRGDEARELYNKLITLKEKQDER